MYQSRVCIEGNPSQCSASSAQFPFRRETYYVGFDRWTLLCPFGTTFDDYRAITYRLNIVSFTGRSCEARSDLRFFGRV